MKPPAYMPIKPIQISSRWFPKGKSFGLYESGGIVAPNVTSILGWKFPFDRSAWVEKEPDIDHDAVTRESAERGTAVHLQQELWLSHRPCECPEELLPWVTPLRQLMSRGKSIRGVEIPVHHSIPGAGCYAGSVDCIAESTDGSLVVCDWKTKRENKRVHPGFLDKQKTQLAAYSIAVSELYRDQLGGDIERCTLVFAHPDRDQPTVVMAEGQELKKYQDEWRNLLREWFAEFGEQVQEEQARFNARQERPF